MQNFASFAAAFALCRVALLGNIFATVSPAPAALYHALLGQQHTSLPSALIHLDPSLL
jgi:hypothetical protein